MIIVQSIKQGKHASIGAAVAAYLESIDEENQVVAVLPVDYIGELFPKLVRVEVIIRHD